VTGGLLDLPKIELHCHLEGSMSSATVKALAARHRPDWSWVWSGDIPDHFSFVDFPDFGRQYLFGLSLLRNEEDLATITDDLAATLAQQNVRYVELTTTAFSHLAGSMPPEVYRDGLDEGRRRAAVRGVELGWVIDIPRDLDDHPLPRMIAAGLTVSINTDDPGWFDTDLSTELDIASDLGVDSDVHLGMQRAALAASFAPPAVRRAITEELDAYERSYS